MSKLKTLEIENFQSHENTVINFSEGFNVFIGASDHGKSAIIRALKWVLFNEPRGDDFITAGKSICRVKVTFTDGTKITRQRSKGTNRYILEKEGEEKQVFEGFGTEVPQEIIKAHGIKKVNFDGENELILNLGEQLEAPFLLNATDALKAKALGRVNGVHIIDTAQKDTVREITRLQGKENFLRKRKEELQEALKEFSDLPLLEEKLKKAKKTYTKIKELKKEIATLEELQKKYLKTKEELEDTLYTLEKTEEIDKARKKTEEVDILLEKIKHLTKLEKKYQETEKDLQIHESILIKTENIDTANETLNEVIKSTQKYLKLKNLFENYKNLEIELKRLKPLLKKGPDLDKATELIKDLDLKKGLLKEYKFYFSRYEELEKRLKKAAQFFKEHTEKYDKLLFEYKEILKTMGRCPVCFSSLDKDHLEEIIEHLKM